MPVARVQRPTEPAGETATPPPLELDYIKPSPSRTEKDEIIACYPYGRGQGGWAALSLGEMADETLSAAAD